MIETRPLTAAERAARDGHRPVVAESTPPSCAETMAAHINDIAATNDGACRDTDLALRGFTADDLRRHGTEASRSICSREWRTA